MPVKEYKPEELAPAPDAAGVNTAPTEKPPSLMQRALGGVENAGEGLWKSALGTAGYAAKMLPGWMQDPDHVNAFGEKNDPDTLIAHSQPAGATQSLFKGVGDAAQFLLPGMGEERAMSLLPKMERAGQLLPKVTAEAPLAVRALQTATPTLARAGYNALTMGLLNKAQGGDLTSGAEGGALTSGVGEFMRGAAPHLAESALGTRWLERGGGRGGGAIGKAALDETRGLLPETVRESASDRISTLFGERQGLLDAASQRPASLAGPRSFLAQAQGRFGPIETGGMAARDPYSQIGEMRSSLFNEPAEMGGKPLPENLTPSEYGRVQQGFNRNNLSWNPQRTLDKEAMGAGKHAYGLMTGELERVAPESVDLNRRIASLMPVEEAANRRSLQAGIGQRMMGRVGAHSGALLGSVAGGTYGYEREGLPGAVKYGALGLALPELVASPAGQMGAARLLYKTGPRLLPAVTGAGLGQFNRPMITSDPATW